MPRNATSRKPGGFARTSAESASPASIITNAIIAKLEEGVSPWRRPWTRTGSIERPLRSCGKPYRGINVIWLWHVAEQRGYTRSTWMTYRQAQEFGAQVRKGETGTMAVFYKSYSTTETDEASREESSSTRRVLRTYTVFNVDQIDNLPERFAPAPPRAQLNDETHRAEIDTFIRATGATIIHGGDRAYYSPASDHIAMPHPEHFATYAAYGAVTGHELIHWSGHPSRLARDLNNRFADERYAFEELIAEAGSAYIGADLGLPVTHLDNHASYIGSWLRILKNDERALLTAAAKAEEAANYLLAKAGRGIAAGDEQQEPEAVEPAPLDIAA